MTGKRNDCGSLAVSPRGQPGQLPFLLGLRFHSVEWDDRTEGYRFLIPSSWEVHKLRGLSAGETTEGQRGQVSCRATKLNQDFID